MKPATIEMCDFVRAVGKTSYKEYAASCPFPVLLEIPADTPAVGSRIELDDAPETTLDTVTTRLKALRKVIAKLRVHVLVPGLTGCLTVGSGKADLRVTGTSPRHAQLFALEGTWRIKDLESRRGTRVENKRIPVGIPIPLVGGQYVTLGDFRCLFLEPRHVHGLARLALRPQPERLTWPRQGLLLRDVLAAVARSVLPGPETGPYLLQIPMATADWTDTSQGEMTQDCSEENLLTLERSENLDQVRLYGLAPSHERSVTIGRSPETDVVLDEASASRRHATLTFTDRGWQLVDLESQNGTFLDGERLLAGIGVPLKSGQTLQFGGFRCVILDADELCNMLRFLERRMAQADPVLNAA